MRVATEQIDEMPAIESEGRAPRLGGTDVFRGSLVILTALIIGGFVLSRGLDPNGNDQDVADVADTTVGTEQGATGTATVPATEESTVVPETTATTDPLATNPAPSTTTPTEVIPEGPVLRSPAEVKVLVLNGAQTQGIAGRGTEVLQAASYLTGAPKNATSQRPSAILYAEGYEAEALAVAAVFGAGLETLVQPLDPADLPIDDIQASHVVVVIGADQLIPIS